MPLCTASDEMVLYNAFDEWYHHALNGMIRYHYHYVINVMFSIIMQGSYTACAGWYRHATHGVMRYHHAVHELIGIIMNCMYQYAMQGLYDFLVQCIGWMISSCTACSENYHHALRMVS